MQRFAASLLTIFWAAFLAPVLTYTTTVVVADDFIGEAINLDNLIVLDDNDKLPLDADHIEDSQDKDRTSNDDVYDNDMDIDIDTVIDNFIDTIKDDDVDSSVYETTDENSTKFFKRLKNNNRLTDILVACFFFIAAIWLILATVYSVILLILLRLQARGELDIYDEDLGRVTICNGRFTLNFGCILRRYAIQLEEDYNQQMESRYGDPSSEIQVDEERPRVRIMTREERRKAMEELLGGFKKTGCFVASENKTNDGDNNNSKSTDVAESSCAGDVNNDELKNSSATKTSLDVSLCCSEEGPVCSICLLEYEPTDSLFRSSSCPHMYHEECLFSWLERRNNTECPCCREVLVSDEDVWTTVQRMRKERRKQSRKENGLIYRFIEWSKSKRDQNLTSHLGDHTTGSTTSVSSGSSDEEMEQESTDVDTNSEELNDTSNNRTGTAEQSSTTSSTCNDEVVGDNNHEEEQQRDR